jgi:nitrite reductase/ring-hydroxylating ferredoxin subunit
VNDFVTVAKVGSIPEGQGASFTIGDRLVAVFHRDGAYHAIDDLCPHMGASLGAGEMDSEGVVTCPWHAWRFDVCKGLWCDNPSLSIVTYPVRVEGEEIQVQLPPANTDSDAG